MDAISFVFGIKTANLRGTQLTDLVYKYLDTTVEKNKNCSVKLTFVSNHNGRDDVILFERHINLKKGGSEFYLNQKNVSWAEYEEKLQSYNILVKAKNFLVFQGDVENIARRSPKELTELLEQISESIEYKSEYDRLVEEHSKAVENGKFLLTQLKSLKLERKQYKDQYKEVKNYNILKTKQETKKLQHIICQLYYQESEIGELQEKIKRKKKTLSEVLSKKEHTQNSISNQQKELSEQQLEMNQLKRDLKVIQSNVTKQEPLAKAKERELLLLSRRIDSNEKELKQAQVFQKDQKAVIEKLEQDLRDLEEQEAYYKQEEERTLREAGQVTLSKAQMNEWSKLRDSARSINAPKHLELSQLEQQQQVDESALKTVSVQQENLKLHLESLRDQQLVSLEKRERELLQAIEDANIEEKNELKVLETLKQENEKKKGLLNQRTKELDEIKNYLQQTGLIALESNRRNYMEECLETLKRLFPGVHGRVVELIKPALNTYKVPLTVVLGKNLDAIVVSEKKVALDCIQYMKDRQIGTCTFLPLDSLQTTRVDDSLRTLGYDSKPIIDVLVYDPQYQRVSEYVCGNTLLCRDLESAKQLAFDRSKRRKVVTYDGDLITKNGLMIGGRSGKIEELSKKWNENEVKQKRVRLEGLTAEIQRLQISLRTVAEEQHAHASLAQLKSKINGLIYEKDLIAERIKKAKTDIESAIESLKQLDPDFRKLEEDISSRKIKIDNLTREIKEKENEIFGPFSKSVNIPNMHEWEQINKSNLRKQAEQNTRFLSQKNRINSLLQYENQKLKAKGVEEIVKQIESDKKRKKESARELDRVSKTLEELQKDQERIQSKIEEKYPLSDKLECNLRAANKDFENQKIIENAVNKAIDNHAQEIMRVKMKRHDLYLLCAEDELELPIEENESLLPKQEDEILIRSNKEMLELFNTEDKIKVDFERLDDEYKNCKTTSQIEALYEKFNEDLKKISTNLDLMTPNMNADSNLKNLEERITKFEQQVNEARQNELKLRTEFDNVRSNRNQAFMEAFNHISTVIDKIYKQLTNEFGVAHLVIDSNDEPYLHATRYTAVPRHKTFRNIDDLSGGEKSVAALALLFAIHSYRPSPFFILDEVDAALDYTNVKIVAKYIQKISKETQFILISLKETCYERADSLVGIYVDRDNLKTSRTLSLDLSQYA